MWQIYPDPGEICYAASSPALLWTYWICNILTDIHLISIPIPILLRASLPPRQKATLIGVFGCTILITLMATVRLVFIKQVSASKSIRFKGEFDCTRRLKPIFNF